MFKTHSNNHSNGIERRNSRSGLYGYWPLTAAVGLKHIATIIVMALKGAIRDQGYMATVTWVVFKTNSNNHSNGIERHNSTGLLQQR